MILGVRPEHISRARRRARRARARRRCDVTIELVQPTGTRTYATFRLGGAEVMAELPAHDVERPGDASSSSLVDMNRADPDRPADRARSLLTQEAAMPMSLSRAIKLFGTEEPVPSRRVLRGRAARRPSSTPATCATSSFGGIEVIRAHHLHRARPELGHLQPRDHRTSRSSRTRTASRSATTRSAATRSRRFAYAARIDGRRRRQSQLRGRRRGARPTSSPTAPASSSCIRSRASAGAPVEVEHVDGTRRATAASPS